MNFKRTSSLILMAAMLVACNESTKPAAAPPANTSAELTRVKVENEALKSEKRQLEQKIEELQQTPDALLAKVREALAANDVKKAEADADRLKSRFADTAQAKTGATVVTQFKAEQERKLALAREQEALGFYVLKPTKSPKVASATLKVESLSFGKTWTFSSYDSEYFVRQAEKESTFVLMNATVQSTAKEPMLPDVDVYVIEGKQMRLLASMRYEYRRWTSHATSIGLYHDFKNDFAHVSAVPFNAAATIDVDDAKKPLAVVTSGRACHERRESQLEPPRISHTYGTTCTPNQNMNLEDFQRQGGQVIAFFNKPKGA